jgi:hypothetical protein
MNKETYEWTLAGCPSSNPKYQPPDNSDKDADLYWRARATNALDNCRKVIKVVELWERTLRNRNGITWNELDAGDTMRLKKCIDDIREIFPASQKISI